MTSPTLGTLALLPHAIAGVRDTRTAKLFFATDAEAVALPTRALHPVVKARLSVETELVRLHQLARQGGPSGLRLTTQQVCEWVVQQPEAFRGLLETATGTSLEGLAVLRDQFLRINEWVESLESSPERGAPLQEADWLQLLGTIGKHAEVKALSDALYGLNIQAEDELASLEIYTEFLTSAPDTSDPHLPRPRCVHCAFVTAGVAPTRSLARAEAREHHHRWAGARLNSALTSVPLSVFAL